MKFIEYEHYAAWRKSRINVTLDYYGEDFFKGKSLLEVGCGFGHVGHEFYKLGAEVVVSDARVELINEVKDKYPHLDSLVVDSEDLDWKYDQDFDIIVHWGLLYHLKNPAEHLALITKHCNHLILESEVLDNSSEILILKPEESDWDDAYSGTGCIPSYGWVETEIIKNNFQYQRLSDPARANANIHHYDWVRENNNKYKIAQRALWFCERK